MLRIAYFVRPSFLHWLTEGDAFGFYTVFHKIGTPLYFCQYNFTLWANFNNRYIKIKQQWLLGGLKKMIRKIDDTGTVDRLLVEDSLNTSCEHLSLLIFCIRIFRPNSLK